MCGVCGVLGGRRHWSAGAAVHAAAVSPTQRAERAQLAVLLDRITRRRAVRVTTWTGTSLLVSGPTGATEIAETLADVWLALDRLAPRRVDPLDDEWRALPATLAAAAQR
jgi:hypothetical protein